MRSVGLVSLPMVTAGVFFIEIFFLGRLVVAVNLAGTSSSNCRPADELRSSSADGDCSVGSCLRFLDVFVAGCFFFDFFGLAGASSADSRSEDKLPSSSADGGVSVSSAASSSPSSTDFDLLLRKRCAAAIAAAAWSTRLASVRALCVGVSVCSCG